MPGRDYEVDVEGLGVLHVDVAYGGNFYAIVEPQPGYADLADLTPSDVLRLSPRLRRRFNERHRIVHPENPALDRLTHVMWTGKPLKSGSTARNAVFYGDKAIDRSPCGTGTSARMAQLHATDRLGVGEPFVHESMIGTTFTGRIERESALGNLPAIVPSIEGWARVTGMNTIFVDERDPLWRGFQLAD